MPRYKHSRGGKYEKDPAELFFNLRAISKDACSMDFLEESKGHYEDFLGALIKLAKEDWTKTPASCDYKKLHTPTEDEEGTHEFKINKQGSAIVVTKGGKGRKHMHLLTIRKKVTDKGD